MSRRKGPGSMACWGPMCMIISESDLISFSSLSLKDGYFGLSFGTVPASISAGVGGMKYSVYPSDVGRSTALWPVVRSG